MNKIPRIPRYEYTEQSVCIFYGIAVFIAIAIAWLLCSGGLR